MTLIQLCGTVDAAAAAVAPDFSQYEHQFKLKQLQNNRLTQCNHITPISNSECSWLTTSFIN